MTSESGDKTDPLKAEALKRDQWRGGTQLQPEDGEGHSLPASEDAGQAAVDTKETSRPRTIAPPD